MIVSTDEVLGPVIDVEAARVEAWRYEQALAVGCDDAGAESFAGSGADLNELRALTAAGCPWHVALRIIL